MGRRRHGSGLGEYGLMGAEPISLSDEEAQNMMEVNEQQLADPTFAPEDQSEAINSEASATPEQALGAGGSKEMPQAPQASHSYWYQKMIEYAKNRDRYNQFLGDAYVHPQVGLQLLAPVQANYHIIRHAFDGRIEQEGLDLKMERLREYMKHVGQSMLRAGGENIEMTNYYRMLDLFDNIWLDIETLTAKVGLGIRFKKLNSARELLRRNRNFPERAISAKDADVPLSTQWRAEAEEIARLKPVVAEIPPEPPMAAEEPEPTDLFNQFRKEKEEKKGDEHDEQTGQEDVSPNEDTPSE